MQLKTLATIILTAALTVMLQPALCQLSHDVNYTRQENIRVAGVTTDAAIDALSITDKQTTFQYTDGYGRTLQTVAMQGSPLQKDLVQPVVYDGLGRQTTGYLPYTSTYTNGLYQYTATTDQPVFYNNTSTYLVARDNSPFASQVFENSPLQRVLQSGMVGDGFQPGVAGAHYKTIKYRSNNSTADGSILLWNFDGSYTAGSVYADNTLSVTDGKDEDNVETLVYTDLAGKTILKRQLHSGGNYDTYYVYNIAGMLIYLIPPKATAVLAANSYSLTTAPLSNLVFNYTYDDHGRVITKTVPAGGTLYIIYDPLNRPVLLQDANMRANNKWNYIKYDVKGRAISQGIYTDATHTTLTAMQAYVAAQSYTTWYESRNATFNNGGHYTNVTFPTTGTTTLAWAYFDDYDLDLSGADDYGYVTQGDLTGEGSATTAKLKGVPTIVSTTTMGNGIAANVWFTTATFYDKRGNPIQVRSKNHLYTGATVLEDTKTVAVSFAGIPTATKVEKITGASTSVKVYTYLSYDHMYRLTGVSQKYNAGTQQVVAAYSYNEIGQIIKKGVGYAGSAGAWLQNIDMRYNIRGQLLTINNSTLTNDMTTAKTNGDTNDVFGMQLFYDQAADGGIGNTQKYNGKLTALKWMSVDNAGAQSKERSYKFAYDDVDRYTAENYAERGTAGTGNFTVNANGFDEFGITYDAGGNIMALKRNSSFMGNTGAFTAIDNLTYTYSTTNPNQLSSVADATGNASGFIGGTGNYTYDPNGNLLADPYKGLGLTYNDLNKTNVITVSVALGKHVDYTYDGGGNLLKKQVYQTGTTTQVTDYVDGFTYVNGILSYFPIPEGRVLNSGGTLTQEFIIGDQQGNARISFKNNGSNVAVVTQENSYYGFGMAYITSTVTPPPTVPNKKLYNGGSEWQNDYTGNMPDYYQTSFRNYDAVLGRFVGVDPAPEGLADLTTYNYAGNNPISYNDPLGDYQLPATGGVRSDMRDNMFGNPYLGSPSGTVPDGWQTGGPFTGNGSIQGDIAETINSSPGGYDNATFYIIYNAAQNGDPEATRLLAEYEDKKNPLPDGVTINVANGGEVDYDYSGKENVINLEGKDGSWLAYTIGTNQGKRSIKILVANASELMDTGHTAIQLNSNYVFGYYPSGNGGSASLMSSKGSPRISNRSDFNDHYGPQGYTEYTLSVTDNQLSSLQNYFSNVMANPGNYNLFLNNCTSVIISGLQDVGIYFSISNLGANGQQISPAFTSPKLFGNALTEASYANPGLVTGMQHYGGN